jgi:hypothetical protein
VCIHLYMQIHLYIKTYMQIHLYIHEYMHIHLYMYMFGSYSHKYNFIFAQIN